MQFWKNSVLIYCGRETYQERAFETSVFVIYRL